LDTVRFANKYFAHVEVNSNGKGLIGSEILSRSVISIDWSNKQIYFSSSDLGPNDLANYGLSIGQAKDKSIYIQSIIEGSSAAEVGIVINMKILKIDSLDFSSSSTFCDYINYNSPGDSLFIKVMDADGNIIERSLSKRELR